MSSLLRTKGVQIGQDNTATNNFTLYQPGVPDGTLRIGNGNSGSTTDALTINSSGNVGIGTSSPADKLDVNGGIICSATTSQIRVGNGVGRFYADAGAVFASSITSVPFIFQTNEIERMRIDSSGRVTTPYQPAFLATKNTTNFLTTNAVKIPLDYTVFNTGNHFNTSTNTFTCPVSGKYLFMWQGYQNGSVQLRIDLYKNGARYVGGYYAISANDGFSSSVLLDAAANDTVYLVLQSASTTLYYGGVEPHTYLSGYLLG